MRTGADWVSSSVSQRVARDQFCELQNVQSQNQSIGKLIIKTSSNTYLPSQLASQQVIKHQE